MQSKHLDGTGLTLRLSPDQRSLSAVFTPVDGKNSLNAQQLLQAVKDEGYGEFLISDDDVEQREDAWRKHREYSRYE